MRALIAVVILLSSALAIGALNPEAPTPPIGSQQQQAKAKKSQPISSADQRGTEQAPLVVKTLPSEHAHTKTDEERTHEQDKATDDRILTISTAALAFITLVLAFYTGKLWNATVVLGKDAKETSERQAREMRDSLEITKKSVDAAERTAKIMEDTAERELRAYVCVESSTGADSREDPSWPTFIINLKNFGKTPAFDVVTWMGVSVQDYPATKFPSPPDEEPRCRNMLGPECKTNVVGSFRRKCTPEEVAAIIGGTKAIYILGRITYRDAFGKDRVTNCQLVWCGPVKGLQNYMTGNDGT
jgi:hypothetical protein